MLITIFKTPHIRNIMDMDGRAAKRLKQTPGNLVRGLCFLHQINIILSVVLNDNNNDNKTLPIYSG